MTAVELEGIRMVYPDGHVAIEGLDLRIEDGEFFVLLGPSGCGKTTALRIVAGLESPTAGEVRFDGTVVTDVRASDRDLSMLFQSSALYPHMSVRDNVAFPLEMARERPRRIRERVATVARRLGIVDLLDRKPSQLSGGQRQRVAMGRALVREPALLLMDEPMSNLDAKLRTELRSSLAALHAELGTTTIYVTHDQTEAMSLADRVAVMRDGDIVQLGSPTDVYREPADLFVATFVGVPLMNVLLGEVADDAHLRVGGQLVDVGSVAGRWPDLDGATGRSVAVGFRPEAVALEADGHLSVEVAGAEWTGAEQFVEVRTSAPAVRWSEDGVTVEPGPTSIVAAVDAAVAPDLFRPVALRLDTDLLQLFELTEGTRLRTAAAAISR